MTEPLSGKGPIRIVRVIGKILSLSVRRFIQIDGAQWAGAFSFNAFVSLFPLIVLLVAIASSFVERDRASSEVIAYMETFIPISGEMQRQIFDTVAGVIQARGEAGVLASVFLVWAAFQCFVTLICATNLAWGTTVHNWWRLPLKSLSLLGITASAVLLGMFASVLIRMARVWLFPGHDFHSWVSVSGSFMIPIAMIFLGLSLFYRLAPRRLTRFSEVWAAALGATLMLRFCESLFVIYLKEFSNLNAVYGTFGGIMALLLWIYLSGCVFIFGACLCSSQSEVGAHSPDQVLASSILTPPRRT